MRLTLFILILFCSSGCFTRNYYRVTISHKGSPSWGDFLVCGADKSKVHKHKVKVRNSYFAKQESLLTGVLGQR